MRSGAGDGLATALSTALRVGVALVIGAIVVPPVAAGVGLVTLFRAPLPGELPDERPTFEAVPSVVLDRNGLEIGQFRGFDRTVEVTQADVPQVLKDAIVAIEDQRFYLHNGVDFEGVARAARTNLELGEIAQGGSTITQQYVKNTYLTGERTFERKFREALLATELEQRMTKDEILFRYLETSYFGSGAYGVGAAAEVYFDKPVSELDISEAATLAGVVQAPTRLSPRVDVVAAESRRLLVLQSMLDQGYLSLEDYEREADRQLWLVDAGARPAGPVTVVAPLPLKGAADHPFFVDWVEAQLLEQVGPDLLYQGGLTIETTVDPRIQEAAEAAAAERLETTEYPVDMAMVTLDPRTGEVLGMVGGRDYTASQVNLAIGGSTGFQPGSSFKPIVLAEAFTKGIGPETVYPAPATWAVPGCSGTQCTLTNYDGDAAGDTSLRGAMHASINTVFAQLIVDVSVQDTIALAQALGMTRFDPAGGYGPSVALGAVETSPLEMASAYGTFANRGVRVAPIGVRRVLDASGNVLIDNTITTGTRVLDEAVADNVTDVLRGVITDGTGGRAAVSGHTIAGKTGTAQEYRAAWFVGYTPSFVTAVWMGHSDGLASLRGVNGVPQVTGGSHPAMAFADVMKVVLSGTRDEPFPVPGDLPEPAETSAEVTPTRREETVVGGRSQPSQLLPDCSGPCRRVDLEPPALPSTPIPPTPPASTTTTTAPAGDTSTSDPAPTTATPPTTSLGTGSPVSPGD